MGCDIHIVVERREAGSEWIGAWSSDQLPGRRLPIAQRDYGFFAEVAAVRGHSETSVYPRNLPKDISRLAWLLYMSAPTDHHSASYATPQAFVDAYRRANPSGEAFRPEFAVYDLLGVQPGDSEGVEHRVVFWFDN